MVVRLDKEAGITSHDAVDRLRRIVGTRRVGHAGTLDPFATGLLLLAWGRATRLLPFLSAGDKTYAATMRLGVTTDSDDTTGRVVASNDGAIDETAVHAAAEAFRGEIEQRAPALSAIKQGGEALHRKARRGEAVTPPVRRVRIVSLSVVGVDAAERSVDFVVTCSAGTYVRSLARDWGGALGLGGALSSLRRLAIGPHPVADAIPTADLVDRPEGSIPVWNARLAAAGLTPEQALAGLPTLVLDPGETRAVGTGRAPTRRRALEAGIPADCAAFRLVDEEGALVGVGALASDGASAAPDEPFELRLVWAAREAREALGK